MIQDGLPRIDPTQMDGIARMDAPIERVSEADRLLIVRMQGLQGFVMGHLSSVYGLKQGDRVEDDGAIVRQALRPDAV